MADVDITSLSVEISAESQGAELNIDKLATAISNLRTKGNVTKVVNSLDKLSASISALKQASTGLSGLDNITNFLNGIGNANFSGSVKSINSVVNAIKKIPAAVSGLNGVDFYSMSGSITELTNAMAPLSILDASGVKAIGSAVNAIGKIPDLTDKLKATDLDSFASSCQKISAAITPLASQLDKVGNAFAKLPPQLSKVVTQANRVTAANERQKKSYMSLSAQLNGFMLSAKKLVSLKAIAEYLGNAVAKFNDFYEATDLFHNAMGNLSGEADALISKMQGLLGVDPTKAMTYMATIQSLGTSFGLASDKAYILSKNLTQLAYDESSYWNKDVAETFTAMSSAISGEIEPIRRLGVDLSQARLKQELLTLGFNKQVSSLSQADKAVLRYIAIMKQTANVQGNLAQTIQSPANQIKILKAQLDMLAKSVGSLLYPAMKSILPPLIAAVQLIREFVEWVAKLMGVKVVFTDFTKSADSVGGIGDAMDNTADSTKKAAKALKDYTMGFDELNIIDPNKGKKSSSSGASAGNILGDVDLSGYDMFKQYNKDFAKQIDAIKQKIKDMLPTIGAVGAAIAAWQISKALLDGIERLKSLTVNVDFDINWSTLGIVAFMADMDEFKRYLDDFIKNGASFNNVVGMISEFAGMMGDALLLLGNLQWAGALKTVQGVLEIVNGIKDIADNGANVDNVTTVIRGLTNIAFAVGLFTKNAKLAGAALVIQGFTTIIREIADNWDAIKNGDWSGVDKATLATAAIEALGGIAVALGVFLKFKKAKEAADSVEAVKSITSATESIKESTSGLSPNLVGIVKNLGLGVAIVAEISAAAILFTGAIAVLGNEMKAVGEAWQPVIDNAKTVAEGIGLGTVTLAAVGAGAATLGSFGGVSLAANIGIGTGILAEVGAAAVLYEAEIWAIGTGLDKIQQAWKPVNNNGSEIAKDIGIGTAILVGIGAVTAAIGAVTVASAGTIPIAIGIGTAVLVECAAAFVGLTESVSGVANSLTDTLYPSLKNLNSKLPSIKTGMSSLTGYLKDFAGELSSYTSSMGSVTWSSIVNGFQKLFVGNPIASLADDVGKIHDDAATLNEKLSAANPELSKAVRLLTSYSDLMSQLKLLTDGASNTELASDIFTNLKDCGEKLVTGFVSGIDGKLPNLNTEVGKIKTSLEKINNEVSVFETAGGNIIKGLIKGINGEKENAYTAIVEVGNKLAEKFETAMDINSPSKVFEQLGVYIVQGLANGITAALPYVEQAMTNLANVAQQKGGEMIDYGATTATNYVNGFISGLDSNMENFKNSLQNDLFGTIQSLVDAFKNGDGKTIGSAIVAVVWDVMGESNRNEVKAFAGNLLSNLTSSLKKIAGDVFNSASKIGKNIWSGITNHFGDIVNSVGKVGNSIYNAFSSLSGPLFKAASQISNGLLGGLVSKFPEILAGVAGVISSIGGAFMGILESIGGVLTGLGIPTGVLMIAGGVAIAAAIAAIVSSLGGSYSSNSSSDYVGTPEYDASTGSTTSANGYYGNTSSGSTSSSDLQGAVYNGCYNAFLDIFQRYGDEITGGKEIKLFIDGKQITASVEKQQSDRGVQIMGTEVYSY